MREPMTAFVQNLENAGIFSREYDTKGLADLYEACSVLHRHLSRLDNTNLSKVKSARVVDLVNAYADTCLGLRKF